eukprot:807905-Amphidinium_carterae.2
MVRLAVVVRLISTGKPDPDWQKKRADQYWSNLMQTGEERLISIGKTSSRLVTRLISTGHWGEGRSPQKHLIKFVGLYYRRCGVQPPERPSTLLYVIGPTKIGTRMWVDHDQRVRTTSMSESMMTTRLFHRAPTKMSKQVQHDWHQGFPCDPRDPHAPFLRCLLHDQLWRMEQELPSMREVTEVSITYPPFEDLQSQDADGTTTLQRVSKRTIFISLVGLVTSPSVTPTLHLKTWRARMLMGPLRVSAIPWRAEASLQSEVWRLPPSTRLYVIGTTKIGTRMWVDHGLCSPPRKDRLHIQLNKFCRPTSEDDFYLMRDFVPCAFQVEAPVAGKSQVILFYIFLAM